MSERATTSLLLKRQTMLADFGEFALSHDDLDEVLTEACRMIAEALGTRRAKVLELQDKGRTLFVRAGVGWNDDVVGRVRLAMTEASSESYAIRLAAPLACSDVALDGRFELPPFMRRENVVALANVPIFLSDRVVYGLLQVDDTKPHDFTNQDTAFLRTCSSTLGTVIDRLFKVTELREAEQRFRLTVEAATDYAIFMTDAKGRITHWLPGAEAVFGWTAAEAVGQPGDMIFTPEDRQAGRPEWEIETARRDGHAPNVREHLCKDGTRVFIDGIVRALFDERGIPVGFIKIGQDVTESRKTDEQLRTLMSGIPQLIWRSADRGYWSWASPQWMAFTGQTQDQAQGRGWLDPVHPDDRDAVIAAWDLAHQSGRLDTEFRLRRATDGHYLWHHTRSTPVRDQAGRVAEWLGTSTDVQAMKELQERQRIMVAELQHRTRNLIGVIRSIAVQTMATTGPTPDFMDRFSDRLAALSRVQGLLSRSEEQPITLRALLQQELDALGAEEGERIRLVGPSVHIRPTLVQTLALGLHELATNARKYGALSSPLGTLTVLWQLRAGHVGTNLTIEWREDGIKCPTDASAASGYGRRLIEKALPYSLGASTTYHLGRDALVCTITLPLYRSTSEGEF